jgi:glycosyltransferase involved in cell wall biosynthesis
MRGVRVLTVGNLYPPHDLGGGYEAVWRAAIDHLRARGHDVRVLTTDHRVAGAPADDGDVVRALRWYWRDHAFPPHSLLACARLELHNARVLAGQLDAYRPDVVSWWSMGGLSLSLLERVRRRGVPAVAFVHDDWLDYGPRADGWLRRGLPPRVDFARAARYVFVSETTRARARAAGRRLTDTGVAHSGIDPVFLDPAPPRAWAWRLLCVGRLDPRKGVDTAIEALHHLPGEATLTVLGGGDERERERLQALGGAVTFAGQRSGPALRDAYAEADAVVFPVRWEEPWGLVPLEAMARGRPVVATGRGGSGEYLRDGVNCLLFEAGDAAALAAAVRRLADDAALRERLVAGGLVTAPRHTATAFNDAVAEELERAVLAR